MDLVKLGLLLLVSLLSAGYHFDNQQRIPEGLSRYHKIRLKNRNLFKVFLILRDKNQRVYFSRVAVIFQIIAYVSAFVNFILAIIITEPDAVDVIVYIDYGVVFVTCIAIAFFDIYYRIKRKK